MRRDSLICLFLILATLVVFFQVGNHDFITFDNDLYLLDNPHVQSGLNAKSVIWAFTNTHAANWHPLTWLSHILDCQLYGLNPRGHHLTNVFFHLANTLLLFLILRRATGVLWQSGIVAALFAFHPLHIESVAWVAERKDVLSTLFWMLTIWTYLHYVESPGIKRYLLIVLSFALGLMAKPMVVTLPFILLLLDYWPLGRFHTSEQSHSHRAPIPKAIHFRQPGSTVFKLVWEKFPLFTLAAVVSAVTFLAQKSEGAVKSFRVFPIGVRFANALVSYINYIKKMIWPQNLAVFYPHPGERLSIYQAAVAGLLLLLMSFLAIRFRRRHPYVLMGWLWYLVTLLPVIGLIQVGDQAMADRYTYVPLIGLFIILAWGTPNFFEGYLHRKIICTLLSAVLVSGLMVCTWLQLRHWQNSTTLFEHALKVTEDNYVAHNGLGRSLALQGRFEEAIGHFSAALQYRPRSAGVHNNLANALASQGKLDEAIAHYVKALELRPNYTGARSNLGAALASQGRFREAIFNYSEALRIKPNSAQAHNNLGVLLANTGMFAEAITHYSKALELAPDYAEAHNNLGDVLARQGKLNEAAAHFSKALLIRPNYPEAHNNLGVSLARQGRLEEAIRNFSKALQLKPDYLQARKNLATALQQTAEQEPQKNMVSGP
jgi:Flp pilus assembly protein TadD